MDRSPLAAQLSLRRSVAAGTRVALAAGDGTFGVINGDMSGNGRRQEGDEFITMETSQRTEKDKIKA